MPGRRALPKGPSHSLSHSSQLTYLQLLTGGRFDAFRSGLLDFVGARVWWTSSPHRGLCAARLVGWFYRKRLARVREEFRYGAWLATRGNDNG